MPYFMSIEPTNHCNLGCTECPSGLKEFSRAMGNVDLNSIQKITAQVKANLIHLILYFQGEPTMVKDFSEIVAHLVSQKIFVSTSTNGHYLTPRKCEEIVKSGLQHLIISMDGFTQEVYETYRKQGNVEKVKIGISNLIEAKQKFKSKTPLIDIQMVVFAHNEHEIDLVRDFSRKIKADKFTLKSAQIYDYEEKTHLIPSDKSLSRYIQDEDGWKINNKLENECWRAQSGCVVTWDGFMVPCCFDKDATYQLGNVLEDSVDEVFQGEKRQKFLQNIQSNRKAIDICTNCTEGKRIF